MNDDASIYNHLRERLKSMPMDDWEPDAIEVAAELVHRLRGGTYSRDYAEISADPLTRAVFHELQRRGAIRVECANGWVCISRGGKRRKARR